jgi:hypothetical protein
MKSAIASDRSRTSFAGALLLAVAAAANAAAANPSGANPSAASGAPESTPQGGEGVTEVLVVGEQPGPGLWKVSNGSHVLWVLGTYGPLPKQMTWRSREVETRLRQSQELLLPVRARPELGFFGMLGVLPSLIGVRDNPNGRKLVDMLPQPLYTRWLALKAQYMPGDETVEKWRPIFAAQRLYGKAVEKAGLVSARSIRDAVEDMARKDGVKVVMPTLKVDIGKPRAAIKELKSSPINDVDCFGKTLDRLETDLDLMRARANAWSTGDIAAMRRMTHIDQAGACIDAVMSSQIAQERGLQRVPEEIADAWITEAESALKANNSTFALLSMDELLKSDGQLARLRARGYTVEEPQ